MTRYIIFLLLFLCGNADAAIVTSGSPKSDIGAKIYGESSEGVQGYFNTSLPNVKNLATCDGVSDDTTVIQSTLDSHGSIFIPANTNCVISNIILTKDASIYGYDKTSKLTFKSGSTGYAIHSSTYAIQIFNVSLDGGAEIDYSSTASAGTRSGIHLYASASNSRIDGCQVYGFNNIGIGANGDGGAIYSAPKIVNSNIYKNWANIDTGPTGTGNNTFGPGTDGGQYLKIIGNSIVYGRYGLAINSGNITSSNNIIIRNYTGLYINGNATNGSHGSATTNLINHNTVSVNIINAVVGYVISSNQIFSGTWSITDSSSGVIVSNNEIDASSMTFSGVGYRLFANNWFYTEPTITDTSTTTIYSENLIKPSNGYVNKKSPLLVDRDAVTFTSVSGTTGSDMVSNGDFSSDTGWTKGTGWTISGGVATSASATGLLTQNIGAAAYKKYLVTWTISGYSGGTARVSIGGSGPTTSHNANGTYTDIVYTANAVNGFLYFYSSGFVGNIDNVIVFEYLPVGTLDIVNVLADKLVMTPTAEPSSSAGTVYYNSSDNHFYGYNGSTWVQLDN